LERVAIKLLGMPGKRQFIAKYPGTFYLESGKTLFAVEAPGIQARYSVNNPLED
jgi:hypothetical protein